MLSWRKAWRWKTRRSPTTTAQKMKYSVKDFFNKCDQIRRKLRIWSHLLKKSLTKNFIFCAVYRHGRIFIFEWFVMNYFSSSYEYFLKTGQKITFSYSKTKFKTRQNRQNVLLLLYFFKKGNFFSRPVRSHQMHPLSYATATKINCIITWESNFKQEINLLFKHNVNMYLYNKLI